MTTFGQKIIERLKRFIRPNADNPVTRNADRFAQLAKERMKADRERQKQVWEEINRRIANEDIVP